MVTQVLSVRICFVLPAAIDVQADIEMIGQMASESFNWAVVLAVRADLCNTMAWVLVCKGHTSL